MGLTEQVKKIIKVNNINYLIIRNQRIKQLVTIKK